MSVRQLVRNRLTKVDEKIAEMKRFRNELAIFINDLEKIKTSDAVICGLIRNSDISSKRILNIKTFYAKQVLKIFPVRDGHAFVAESMLFRKLGVLEFYFE